MVEKKPGDERFIVIPLRDERVPEWQRTDFGWAIYDTKKNEVVADDRSEPEDQLFVRDLAWVPARMNALNAEREKLRELLSEVQDWRVLHNGSVATCAELSLAPEKWCWHCRVREALK